MRDVRIDGDGEQMPQALANLLASEPGNSTTFTIMLPTTEGASTPEFA